VRAIDIHDAEHLAADGEREIGAPLDVFGDAGQRAADLPYVVEIHARYSTA